MRLLLLTALLCAADLESVRQKVREDVAQVYGEKTPVLKPRKKAAPRKVKPGSAWEVYRDGKLVLQVLNRPGLLIGQGLPAPGAKPPKSGFLTATARDAVEEGRLREHLEKSRSTAQFLDRLDLAGYDVKPAR